MSRLNFDHDDIVSYTDFINRMVDNQWNILHDQDLEEIKKNQLFYKNIDYTSTKSKASILCPEPISFLQKITKEAASEDKKKEFLKLLQKLEVNDFSNESRKIWFNRTIAGVNLRLGDLEGDTGNQEPAILGDDCVHGVIVGRTGSGKSVLLNNIILNLTKEYAPWELDLFLVDMKKVELSRYMANMKDGGYLTPHVTACGATSEVPYVVSMIQYITECMKARQSLFASLGIQKIQDFREKYSKELGVEVVLPRIVLLIDEFQQLFLEASSSEKRLLDECIASITKLGRATGVHLLLASQEMSGSLGSKELANFKLRIALPCDAAVSEKILGNLAAARIEGKGRTLVNKKGGSKEIDNIEYRTPFVNVKGSEGQSEFQIHLEESYDASKQCGFRKIQKFYQEDVQEGMDKVAKIRSSASVKNQVTDYLKSNPVLVDAIVLGTSVRYSNLKNDYVSFFLEKGKKRNIGILCSKDSDIVNTLKLLAENFIYSELIYEHTVIYENEILRAIYSDFIEDLGKTGQRVREENYEDYSPRYQDKLYQLLSSLNYSTGKNELYKKFFVGYIDNLSKEERESLVLDKLKSFYQDKRILSQVEEVLNSLPELGSKDSLDEILRELRRNYQVNLVNLELPLEKQKSVEIQEKQVVLGLLLKVLIQFKPGHKYQNHQLSHYYNCFLDSVAMRAYQKPFKVTWLIGTDTLDRKEDRALSQILEHCTNHHELFVLAGYNTENLDTSYRCCNYLFIKHANEQIYNRYRMNYSKKSLDNKMMDFKIVNYNQERSYKQLLYDFEIEDAPKLDLEEIEV